MRNLLPYEKRIYTSWRGSSLLNETYSDLILELYECWADFAAWYQNKNFLESEKWIARGYIESERP